MLCFTHGEASTLHGVAGDLATIRAREFRAAAEVLGISWVELLDYPDGALAAQPPDRLIAHVQRAVTDVGADGLLVFDHGGITGHPDHQTATDAALAAAATLDRTVLAWALPRTVADALNHELGTTFGRDPDEVDFALEVDRGGQLEAISCHASQATDNPVVRRRLELQQDHEWLRVLRQRQSVAFNPVRLLEPPIPSAEADERASGPVDVPDSVHQPAPAAQRPGVGQMGDCLLHQRAQPCLQAVPDDHVQPGRTRGEPLVLHRR